MEILRLIFIFFHFLGLASLLGGFLLQLSSAERRVVPAMIHGWITQLVTGIGLVGIDEALGESFGGNAKVGTKLGVLVVIAVVMFTAPRGQLLSQWRYFAIGGLTAVNVAVAVFWT